MINMYDEISSNLSFNKFEIGDMLFVEYKCPFEDESAGIWTHMDSFIHVLSGQKTWRTTQGSWTAKTGQTLFIKRGASIIDQYMDEDFCVLLLFVSDDFVREVIKENSSLLVNEVNKEEGRTRAIRINSDIKLSAYFQSMLSYFSDDDKPSEPLLTLKLKELILNILLSPYNPELSAYLLSLSSCEVPSLQKLMEANYCFNLSINDFAKLCHRSLTTFKRDFQAVYHTSPGKWLLQKRLEYSAVMLRNTNKQVTQICFECGFEDLSHFSRSFKAKYGQSPVQFRKKASKIGS